MAQEEILGLEPRSPREPRPDSKQQLSQKRDHRPLHYHYAHPRVIPDKVFGRHKQEGQGRLIIRGTGLAANHALLRSRIENVARRAMVTQPERRIVSIDAIESKDEKALEVLTTSQKLTHRIAHDLKKAFGGRTSYNWSDDGTLFATWEFEKRKPKAKKASRSR